MEIVISLGILMALTLAVFCLIKWWNVRCIGVTPVHLFTFMAILFTSGLDVGLIMFPLAEFPGYGDDAAYSFANPLAIEFAFWGFLIWAFYFLTSFYFCVVEPRVRFFEIPWVKLVNNIVIIGTCAFTAALFLIYLPGYVPEVGDGETILPIFYVVVLLTIVVATYSSTDIKFVRILSVSSTFLFFALIAGMWAYSGLDAVGFGRKMEDLGEYFTNLHRFVLPLTDYHAFYLFWWFSWSIMIGQFTSRFVGGLRTYQLFAALLVLPSIPLAIWFSVLYHYYEQGIDTRGLINVAMVVVGVTFVVNSLDSLIRLYTDNLNLTVHRLGKFKYLVGNVAVLFLLTLLFQNQWLQIQWIGAVVIGLYLSCLIFIILRKRKEVVAIDASPEGRDLDFHKVESLH